MGVSVAVKEHKASCRGKALFGLQFHIIEGHQDRNPNMAGTMRQELIPLNTHSLLTLFSYRTQDLQP